MDSYRQPWKTTLHQIFAAGLACSLSFHVGVSVSFTTVLLPPEMLVDSNSSQIIESNDISNWTINGTAPSEDGLVISKEQASWVASILALTCAVASCIAGLIMDRCGRKVACLLSGLCYFAGWTVISSARTNVDLLYIGRTLCGAGNGLSMTGFVYASETTHTSIRTPVMATGSVFSTLGILYATIVGYFFTWRWVAITSAVISAVACIGLIFVPETPIWLSNHVKDEEKRKRKLEKSLKWLYKDQKIYNEERQRLGQMIQAVEVIPLTKDTQDVENKPVENRGKLWKAIFLGCGLFFFQQTTGGMVVIVYAIQIFQVSTENVSGWTCLILLGVIRLLMALAATFQYFGRRTLLLISSIGMTASIITASATLHFVPTSIVTVIFVLIYVTFTTFGVLIVPWTMTSELLPSRYRGMIAGYLFGFSYLLMFVISKLFISIAEALGMANIFLIFGLFSAGAFVFVYFWIPETRGRTLDEIQDAL